MIAVSRFYGRRQSYGGSGGCLGSPPGIRDPGIVSNLRPLLHKHFLSANKYSLSLYTHTHTAERNHITVNVVLLIITVSLFNEHCRYIIENKSENRRDVSRVVKVPGIILCYILSLLFVIVVFIVKKPRRRNNSS